MRNRSGLVFATVFFSTLWLPRAHLPAQICQEDRGPNRPCSIDAWKLLGEGAGIQLAASFLGIPISWIGIFEVSFAARIFPIACQNHYECYRYGFQTYGYDRARCDDDLRRDMTATCNTKSGLDRDLCFFHRDIIYWVMVAKGAPFFTGTPFWDPQRTGPYCEYAGPGRNYHVPELPEVAELLFNAGVITQAKMDRIKDLVSRFTDPSSYDVCGQSIPECVQSGREPLLSEAALHYRLLETIDPGLAAELLGRTPGCEVRIVHEQVSQSPSGPGFIAVERFADCDSFLGYRFDWRNAFLNRWERMLDCRLGPDDDGDGISNGCDLCPKYADPTNGCAFADAAQAVLEDPNWAGGTGWGDYDGDGDLDLYVISTEPYQTLPSGTMPRLFRNQGNGTFQDVTSASGFLGDPAKLIPGWPQWIDYDNDGRLDLFLEFRYELLHNQGNGRFTDASNLLPPRVIGTSYWKHAIWLDFDQDGFLDVHFFQDSGPSGLFRNIGGTSFDDITNLIPEVESGVWIDVDADGDLDLYSCAEDRLYRNLGTLNFSAAEPLLGIERCASGTWGDFDSDGDLDVFVPPANAPFRPATILRNDLGAFVDVSPYVSGEVTYNGAFCTWVDFDNDGFLDLHVNQSNDGSRNLLLRNLGQGDFADASNDLIENFGKCGVHTWGDYNGDGFLDIFQANNLCTIPNPLPPNSFSKDRLLKNSISGRPNHNHWLQVDLVGTRSNSHGIGSRILLHQRDGRDAKGEAVNHAQVRYVMASPQESLTAQFGLGPVAGTVDLDVLWPSGTVQTLSDVQPDRRIKITEPEELVYATPLRIDIGGRQKVDSLGRTWLGDITPLSNDPLRIRPANAGGNTTARGWLEENFHPESIADLGFDPSNQNDRNIFTSMRVDQNTTDGADFLLEVPVANGLYLVNLFFCDNETDQRRFKIAIQGEVVDGDVSVHDYSPEHPVRGWAGRMQFPGIEVQDGMLRIALLPCPGTECLGGTVERPFLSALEVLSLPRVEPPAIVTGLTGISAEEGVQLSWDASTSPGVAGYRVYRSLDAPGAVLSQISTDLVPSPSYVDATAELGKSYRYQVSAVNVLEVEGPRSSPMVITYRILFRLSNIRLDPSTPGCLSGPIEATFDYDVVEPVRVRAIPDTMRIFQGDPSPEYPAGTGTGKASFSILSSGADIHGMMLRVLSPDLKQTFLEKTMAVDYRNSPCTPFRRGDANDSGSADLSDAVFIFSYLFVGGRTPPCLEAADVNNSGRIDISDGVRLLNFLFRGGPPIPAPTSAACGLDPDPPGSAGDIGCLSFTSC